MADGGSHPARKQGRRANFVRTSLPAAVADAAAPLVAAIRANTGDRLHLVRALLGVLTTSHTAFAELCGVQKGTVADWLSGRRPIPESAFDAAVSLVAVARQALPAAPLRGQLCIDRLVFVGNDATTVDGVVRFHRKRAGHGRKPPLYQRVATSYGIRIGVDPHPLFIAAPAVRVELNPATLTADGWALATYIVRNVSEWRLTRVDVAVDHADIDVDDVRLLVPRIRRRSVDNGERFGTHSSAVSFCSYDRETRGTTATPVWRLEARATRDALKGAAGSALTLGQLAMLRDPFARVQVATSIGANERHQDSAVVALVGLLRRQPLASVAPDIGSTSTRRAFLDHLVSTTPRFIEHQSTTFGREFSLIADDVVLAFTDGVVPFWARESESQ